MRRALALLLAAVAPLSTSGCGGSGSVRVFNDPHGAIRVKEGATFAVSLRQNASVGFTWRQAPGSPAGAAVESAGDAYSPDDAGKVGGGGQHRFSFRAVKRGRAMIRLRRSFRDKPRELRIVSVYVR